MFTLGEAHALRWRKPMPVEKQSRLLQLVLCCQHASHDVEMSQKTANIFKNQKDMDEEDGACSWAKSKIIITAECQT